MSISIFLIGVIVISVFICSIANVGTALCKLIPCFRTSAAFPVYAMAAGFVANGLAGALLWMTGMTNSVAAIVVIVGINLLSLVANFRTYRAHEDGLLKEHSKHIPLWFFASLAIFSMAHMSPKQPAWLEDGLFVYKAWTLPVKLQLLTGGMPADNALPAYAGEMMARDISFKDNRPLMPGQEVSNRPILLSSLYLPYRLIFGGESKTPETIPTINYVGQDWPNFGALFTDKIFSIFLAIAITANAAIFVTIFYLFQYFGLKYAMSLTVACGVIAPYIVLHTIFTWPKNLAGFFIAAAFLAALDRRHAAWIVGLAALGYWAHSYAILFAFGFCVYVFIRALQSGLFENFKVHFKELSIAAISVIAILAPWFLWTRLGLQIEADLLSQNAGAGRTSADIWNARFLNISTIFSFNWLSMTPNGLELHSGYRVSLLSALGPILLLIMPAAVFLGDVKDRALLWAGILFPTTVVTLLFGVFNPPIQHGWQAAIPMLLVITFAFLLRFIGQLGTLIVGGITALTSIFSFALYSDIVAGNHPAQSLLLNFQEDTIAENAPNVGVRIDINGVAQPSLFNAAPSRSVFGPFELSGEDTHLRGNFAVHPSVFEYHDGDETVFQVEATDATGKTVLLSEDRLDVRTKPEQRTWMSMNVAIPQDLQSPVTIALKCEAGKNNNSIADWCVWGTPTLSATQ